MFYSIYGKNLSATLVTSGGVVTDSTDNLQWTRGKRIGLVLGWAKRQRLCWSVMPSLPQRLTVHGGKTHWVH